MYILYIVVEKLSFTTQFNCMLIVRMTLLLGPPGAGKTTFLQALAGRLDKDLKVIFFKELFAKNFFFVRSLD